MVDYAYDAASRISGLTYKLGATVLGDLTYAHDPAGNRTQVGGTWARTGLPQPVASATYNAANQLTQWGATALTYDLNGNLTNDGTKSYTWDARNQLLSMTGASFAYDGLGRRIRRGVGGTTTDFLYDGVNPVQELAGSSPIANLLPGLGIDESFTRTDVAGSRSFLVDALGSTLALTDSVGAVQTEYSYEPFGKTSSTGAASSNPFQFTGRENDTTGLYYYRARYYHPTLQRFISEDPLRLASGDPNLYAYVENSPISLTDPFGLCVDPGGPGIRYCIDRFIPDWQKWSFRGDYRGPEANNPKGTFRMRQLLPGGATTAESRLGRTIGLIPPFVRLGIFGPCGGGAVSTPLGGRKIRVFCVGYNGLTPPDLTPPIFTDVTIMEGPTGPVESLRIRGTPYPALEIWQYGGPNGPQLLYYYPATGKNPGNLLEGPTRLR